MFFSLEWNKIVAWYVVRIICSIENKIHSFISNGIEHSPEEQRFPLTSFIYFFDHMIVQGLTIKFQDCASKTGKKVSKKIINFFKFKIHPVRVDTTLGACFQASECSFEVRL